MTDDQNDDQEPGRLRQMYEESARRAAEAEARAEAVERREMFRDAGLDLANKQHAAFAKAYDGTLDQEAVRSYVTDLGVGQPTPQPPVETPVVPQSEQEALVRIAEAARDQGGPPPQPDRRAQIAEQMANLPRNASPAEYDRLAVEYTRAGGNRSTQDQPA